jgi:hypothetical protein
MFPLPIGWTDPPRFEIVGGEESADYPGSVALYAADAGATGDFFCSGTLVAPDAVVTCAHCVDRLREYQAANNEVSVLFGTRARGGIDEFAHVIASVQHPDWVPNRVSYSEDGSDIAVLQLDRAIDDVDPVPMYAGPVDDAWTGQELDFVGWGATNAAQVDSGVKRHVRIPVTGVDDLFVIHGAAGSGLNTCFGDSGGSVFRTFDDGLTRLVAIPSVIFRHSEDPDICVDGWGWDLRVDARLSFITDSIASFDVDTDVPPDTDVEVAGPHGCGCDGTPGTPTWIWLGGGFLARRRRGGR